MFKGIFLLLIIFGNNYLKPPSKCILPPNQNEDCSMRLEKDIGNIDYVDANTGDETSNTLTFSDFKTSYFYNLNTNFGKNYKGSCGYVAIGMMLSYYDTYLSDDIIQEQYDVRSTGTETNMIERKESPGIMCDSFSGADNMNASEYYSKISSVSDTSLHAKLMTIGESLGYYDYSNFYTPCGTVFSTRMNVLENYLSNNTPYTLDEDYSYSYLNGESSASLSDSVREFAIEKVQDGSPVLLSVSGDSGGHVVVAYDYDADKDELYCHMGWDSTSTHDIVEEHGFDRYKTALAIEFNFSHSCSDNYSVISVDEDGNESNALYCYHDCHIKTFAQSWPHSYTDHYESYSNTKHKSYCVCGRYKLYAHAVSSGSTYKIGTHTYGNCIECRTRVDLGTTTVLDPFLSPKDSVLEDFVYIVEDNEIEKYVNEIASFDEYKEGGI